MARLRNLSGNEVVTILEELGFRIYSQRGSHVKLRRVIESGISQTITVPRHREIDRGTLRSVFRQASRFIPERILYPYFYRA